MYPRCLICHKETENVFNINLTQKPICESCANAITMQQVAYLIKTPA
jgi:hypothetical protein